MQTWILLSISITAMISGQGHENVAKYILQALYFICPKCLWLSKMVLIWQTKVVVVVVVVTVTAMVGGGRRDRADSLQWRHNGRDSVSNHQPYDCLLNCLFRHISKKTSKLRVTGLCVGNLPLTSEFPAQMASNAKICFHLMTSSCLRCKIPHGELVSIISQTHMLIQSSC